MIEMNNVYEFLTAVLLEMSSQNLAHHYFLSFDDTGDAFHNQMAVLSFSFNA